MKLAIKEFGQANSSKNAVLIHGTGARAEMWSPQIKLLEDAGWHCLVPDLRGHGESAEPGEQNNLKSHITDILETLADCDLSYPAVFVGHSLGSIISIELAADYPEMVSKILAVSLPGKVPALTVSAFRIFMGFPYRAIKGSFIHRSLGWRERVLLDTNYHSLNQVVQNFADLDYVSALPPVKCPVHFAVGRLDPVAPAMHVETMHKKLPSSTLEVIEWAGHNCMDSQPAAFNRWFMSKMNQ